MTLGKHVSIARRFHRSIRLDSDLTQVDALQGFVCQRSATDALLGVAAQIAQTKQRAFTWTGPYGGGKSSLAVIFGALLASKGPLRNAAVTALGSETAQWLLKTLRPSREGWLVVPVIGRRGDAVADIATALEQARRRDGGLRGRPRREVRTGRELLERLTQEAAARPHDGVLLLVDEFGKFLEGAAADGGDIYFFQELAEVASRSQGRLVMIGILHQAFEQYASRLGHEARDEWGKVQGRFADVPLISGIDEVVDLLGRAIVADLPHPTSRAPVEAVIKSIRSRRSGSSDDLAVRLDACWPLHPVTAMMLGPISRRRFGQNERSVFGFLTSAEPGGFQEFLRSTAATTNEFFGPERFWDYLRLNLEPAILASNDSHRWAQGADAIERCEARGTPLHTILAKSIALIDMFRSGSGLAADRETLMACASGASNSSIDAALADLERWSIVVFRRHLGAWAVYAGSDFDIDGAVTTAKAQASVLDLGRLSKLAGLQPVLAKRHYHETGCLRWFQTELVQFPELGGVVSHAGDAAGRFLLSVPPAGETRKVALAACRSTSAILGDQLVVVGLSRNAARIRELGCELIALEMVRSVHPELDGDSVARREIMARIAGVSAEIEEEFREGFANAEWFVGGERVVMPPGASLSHLASDLADQHYDKAPRIHSELINRQKPSSNTQAGVRDLMYAMISASARPFLGIAGFPVHRGLYSTVLGEAGLHRDRGAKGYGFAEPSDTEAGRSFRPAWEAGEALFSSEQAAVPLGRLYRIWAERPFGIRRGVMPILALAFVLANRNRFAVYCERKFQVEIDSYLVDILLQDENLIALRRVDVDGFRGAILSGVASAVEAVTGLPCSPEPLEVARRLVRFTLDLPPWTRRTLGIGLSSTTIEVRRVLLQADDPHKALFVDLPAIFGEGNAEAAAIGIEVALLELGAAYPSILHDLSRKMLRALGQAENKDLSELRRRARTVADLTGDLRLDAFAARLSTFAGEQADLEQIATLAINRPVRDWTDRDPDQAALALAELALRFRRAEILARVKGRTPSREAMALIIGTGEVGHEVIEEFEVADCDRPRVTALARALSEVITRWSAERGIVLAALAEAGLQAVASRDSDLREEK